MKRKRTPGKRGPLLFSRHFSRLLENLLRVAVEGQDQAVAVDPAVFGRLVVGVVGLLAVLLLGEEVLHVGGRRNLDDQSALEQVLGAEDQLVLVHLFDLLLGQQKLEQGLDVRIVSLDRGHGVLVLFERLLDGAGFVAAADKRQQHDAGKGQGKDGLEDVFHSGFSFSDIGTRPYCYGIFIILPFQAKVNP